MEQLHAAVFFGTGTGIISAGLISSLWSLAFDDPPKFSLLLESDFLTPLKVIVVVLAAPIIVLSHSVWWLVVRPPVGVLLLLAGLCWSFLQGVFILTRVFNIS
jgi:hypothetical protein